MDFKFSPEVQIDEGRDLKKKKLKFLLTSAKFAKNAFLPKYADVSKNFKFFFIKSLPFMDLHLWRKFEVNSLILLKVIQVPIFMTSSKS